MTLPAPGLLHVFDLAVTVDMPVEVGQTAHGLRRMIPITGGTLRLSAGLATKMYGQEFIDGHHGLVVPGGADYQLILDGGTTAHLDARYVIEMLGGARLFVSNQALRVASPEDSKRLMRGEPVDASRVYFRCQPRFETPSVEWAWLEKHQFVGTGVRLPDAVHLSIYQVL